MSDNKKKKKFIYFIFLKEEDLRLFLVAKSEKTYKKYFSHQPVLVRNGFLNSGPFAEVESTIRLVRLIKSAVAPLLWYIPTSIICVSTNKRRTGRQAGRLVGCHLCYKLLYGLTLVEFWTHVRVRPSTCINSSDSNTNKIRQLKNTFFLFCLYYKMTWKN